MSLAFIAIVHLGTLAAILVYFWKDLWEIIKTLNTSQALGWKILVGTLPAAVAGLVFGSLIEEAIQGLVFIGGALFFTGIILIASELGAKTSTKKKYSDSKTTSPSWKTLSYSDALLIGLAQVIALIPGISRSGVTMAAGLLRGLPREDAVRFSFLLSTPVVAGAGLLSVLQLVQDGTNGISMGAIAIGFSASFVFGIGTIHFFLRLIRQHSFIGYGIYTAIAAIAVIIWGLLAS